MAWAGVGCMLLLMSHVAESRTSQSQPPMTPIHLFKSVEVRNKKWSKSSPSHEQLTTHAAHREQLDHARAFDGTYSPIPAVGALNETAMSRAHANSALKSTISRA